MPAKQSKMNSDGAGASSGLNQAAHSLKTKIFVDGNCIICDAEISHYKRLAPDLFQLVDISDREFDPTKFGLTSAGVNKNMHVQTPRGEVKVGVDAFVHIWSRLSRYKTAATLIQWPIIYQMAKLGYCGFTIVRPYLPKRRRPGGIK